MANQKRVSVTNQSNIHMYIVQPGMVTVHLSIFLDRLIELLRSLVSWSLIRFRPKSYVWSLKTNLIWGLRILSTDWGQGEDRAGLLHSLQDFHCQRKTANQVKHLRKFFDCLSSYFKRNMILSLLLWPPALQEHIQVPEYWNWALRAHGSVRTLTKNMSE